MPTLLNAADIPPPVLLDPGDYDVVVQKMFILDSKKGEPVCYVILDAVDEPEAEELFTIVCMWPIKGMKPSEQNKQKASFEKACVALDLPSVLDSTVFEGEKMEWPAAKGSRGRVRVVVQERDGVMENRVKKFLPPGE